MWKPTFSIVLKLCCCIKPGKQEIFSAHIKGFVDLSFYNLRAWRPILLHRGIQQMICFCNSTKDIDCPVGRAAVL